MSIVYILLAILMLGLLVTVHEWGHFIAARRAGIEVMEFSIGFGPALFQRKTRSGMTFSLRPIPLGGYCAFYGEDDMSGETAEDPRAYNRQSVWKRILSVIMGPMMNFVLAFAVAFGFYWAAGVDVVTGYQSCILQVDQTGPAAEAGLQPGDIILTIDGANMQDGTYDTLSNTLRDFHEGQAPYQMTIDRGGEIVEAQVLPAWYEEDGYWRIGVTISNQTIMAHRACGPWEALGLSWDWCVYAGGAILNSLRDLFTTPGTIEQLSGPVGVVSAVSQQVQTNGVEGFVSLLVLISINLGIFNLLPIPGLDGSRLMFMLVEAVRHKPVPAEWEARIHLAGYVLLLGLMVFCTWQDILRLIS